MKRNSFIKSLIGLIVAPKLITKISWGKKRFPVNEDMCINLPDDYMNISKIGILKTDGRIEVLNSSMEIMARTDIPDYYKKIYQSLLG